MTEGQSGEAPPPPDQSPENLGAAAPHPSGSSALAAAAEAAGLNSDPNESSSDRRGIRGLMHDIEHRFDEEPDEDAGSEEVVIPISDNYQPLEPSADREDDIHKAETMARYEDDFRTKAVKNRDVVRPGVEHLQAEIKLQESQGGRRERRQLRRERDRLEAKRNAHTDSEGTYDILDARTRSQFVRDFPEEADRPAEDFWNPHYMHSPNDRANYYDEQAARVGEWAGALHDHPLSTEFKKAHPGIQFQPKQLVRMEDSAARMEQEIVQLNRIDESAIGNDIADAAHAGASEAAQGERREISRMLGVAGEEGMVLYDEWEAMQKEAEELGERFGAFNRRVIDEIRVPDLQNSVAVIHNLLNEVRREAGLSVVGDEAESAAPDQPQDNNPETGEE